MIDELNEKYDADFTKLKEKFENNTESSTVTKELIV